MSKKSDAIFAAKNAAWAARFDELHADVDKDLRECEEVMQRIEDGLKKCLECLQARGIKPHETALNEYAPLPQPPNKRRR